MEVFVLLLAWVISFQGVWAAPASPDFKGCPDNALCTREAGLLRGSWQKMLEKKSRDLESFRRKRGIPLEIWTRDGSAAGKLGDDRIHYDSPCSGHQGRYRLTEVFSSDFQQIARERGAFLRQGLLLSPEGKRPARYFLPRGDVPLYVSRGRLFFRRNFEGSYYGISVGRKGDVRVEKRLRRPKDFAAETSCPASLTKSFARLKHPPLLYAQNYCLKLPDAKGELRHTIILGWSCP